MASLKDYLAQYNPFQRTTDPNKIKKNLGNVIAPVQFQRYRQDAKTWREAVAEAENVFWPQRVRMQRIYNDTILNGHVASCWERRKDLTMLRKWEFVDENGKINDAATRVFQNIVKGQAQNKDWFDRYISYSLDALMFGYSLIAHGDIVDSNLPNLDIVKRWNVSPDRKNVTTLTYSIAGTPFEDEEYADWHSYVSTPNDIGSSSCGYGLLYKIAIYEIYLRNVLGQNADFTELYSQPYRVGKTTKEDKSERMALEDALKQMGSAGYAVLDPNDEIQFLETALGGTGWQGYENFEQRLEKKISKIILGHADALDSVPGKLGNSKEESPAEKAMQDKQTKDGVFIQNVVNTLLIPKLRNLGLNIPNGVIAVLKNDAEIVKNNNAIIAQAVEMSKAGIQISREFFTQQTGIPTEEVVAPAPLKPNSEPVARHTESIKNKLNEIYSRSSCNCGGKHHE